MKNYKKNFINKKKLIEFETKKDLPCFTDDAKNLLIKFCKEYCDAIISCIKKEKLNKQIQTGQVENAKKLAECLGYIKYTSTRGNYINKISIIVFSSIFGYFINSLASNIMGNNFFDIKSSVIKGAWLIIFFIKYSQMYLDMIIYNICQR